MPADRRLNLLPSSAAALAEAAPGEEVKVWVAMAPMTRCFDCLGVFPAELEVEDDTCPLCGETACLGEPEVAGTEDDTVEEFEVDPHLFAPAAEGERVEVWCPRCGNARAALTCAYCLGGTIPATVVSDPVPEKFCEECENEGCREANEPCCERDDCPACGGHGAVPTITPCPCNGDPPYAWRLTFRRDGGGDE